MVTLSCSGLYPLTRQDRIRLKSLEKQELYRNLVVYMLEKDIKLEQEIMSFMGREISVQ